MGSDDGRLGAPRLTPAERALREAAGPIYFELGAIADPPESSIAAVEPDDWRLYHLMRNLPVSDRMQIPAFAEMLYNLRHALDWANPAGEDRVTEIR